MSVQKTAVIGRRKRLPVEPRYSRERGDEGMTLIELMIAAGIAAIAFVLLSGSLMSIATTNATTDDHATAAIHVNSVMEEIRPLDRVGLLAYAPPAFRGLGASEQVAVQIQDAAGNWVNLPAPALAPAPPNPARLRVTVAWLDNHGRNQQVRVGTEKYWW